MSYRDHLRALAEALPPGAAVSVPREWLLELLGGLPGSSSRAPADLLTVKQAAARLSVTPAYLYRKAKALPFAVKLSHKQLRFDPVGLEAWLRERRNGRARSVAANAE